MNDGRPSASAGVVPPIGGALRPDVRFLLAHPAHLVALGFGCGLAPAAPGTVGTLCTWLAFGLAHRWLGDAAWGALLALLALVAWWASTLTARHLRSADPGSIVIDEIVAFALVLWLVLPASWWMQAAAFALFRLFDAAKPGPVAWADRRFKPRPGSPIGAREGFGIVFDDLVAAGLTLLVLALWKSLG